jgi:hypothetical protein
MSKPFLDPNVDVSALQFTDADGFYAELLHAHEGLDRESSALLDAQLVLLLANQVAEPSKLRACLRAARAALPLNLANTPS